MKRKSEHDLIHPDKKTAVSAVSSRDLRQRPAYTSLFFPAVHK
jgi:hypothetical protein